MEEITQERKLKIYEDALEHIKGYVNRKEPRWQVDLHICNLIVESQYGRNWGRRHSFSLRDELIDQNFKDLLKYKPENENSNGVWFRKTGFENNLYRIEVLTALIMNLKIK